MTNQDAPHWSLVLGHLLVIGIWDLVISIYAWVFRHNLGVHELKQRFAAHLAEQMLPGVGFGVENAIEVGGRAEPASVGQLGLKLAG